MKKPFLAVILFIFLSTLNIFPNDSLTDLLDRKVSDKYTAVETDILGFIESAGNENIPISILTGLLREGIAKSAPPEILRNAVLKKLTELTVLSNILEPHMPSDKDPELMEDTFRKLEIYLSIGVNMQTVTEAFRETEDINKALKALGSIAKIIKANRIDAASQLELLEAFRQSRLSPRYYDSIPAVFLQGRNAGLHLDEIKNIVVDTLKSGGGVIQINRKIKERSPRR
jgi:hypothetical protein